MSSARFSGFVLPWLFVFFFKLCLAQPMGNRPDLAYRWVLYDPSMAEHRTTSAAFRESTAHPHDGSYSGRKIRKELAFVLQHLPSLFSAIPLAVWWAVRVSSCCHGHVWMPMNVGAKMNTECYHAYQTGTSRVGKFEQFFAQHPSLKKFL